MTFVLVCVAALASGCGTRGGQPGAVPADGKQVEAKEPIADRENAAEEPPDDAPQSNDDLSPGAKHGLVRGLEKLRQSIPVEKARPAPGAVDLRQADEMLSSAKSQNLAALREAARQVRIAGRGVNCVLLVVEGLRCEQLGCYAKAATETPRIDELAAEGVRFVNFHVNASEGHDVHWPIMTGLRAPARRDGQDRGLRPTDFTLPKVLWYAGYATALIGDLRLGGAMSPGGAAGQGFETWSGYGDSTPGCPAWPEQFWYQDSRVRVLENSHGKHGRHAAELMEQEIVRYLGLHRRGRPFFLYLAWPRFEEPIADNGAQRPSASAAGQEAAPLAIEGQKSNAGSATNVSPAGHVPVERHHDIAVLRTHKLDLLLGAIVDRLKALDLSQRTVVFLIGGGDPRSGPATGAAGAQKDRPAPEAADSEGGGRPAPLIVWAPRRFAHGVREQHCTPCDILPTLAELADANRRPKTQTGTSLVPTLRRDRRAGD